ncbi:MAG: ferric reductase-like transmembrane domain-containing protein [Candidatus Thermoplasmatota archaeon]
MAWRRLSPLLALALCAAAASAALDDSAPGPERQSTCWTCHTVQVGGSPPIRTFLELLPPPAIGQPVGVPYDYVVQISNGWTAELLSVRLTVNLTNAPSLGFASEAVSFDEVRAGEVAFNPGQPTTEQRSDPQTFTIPADEGEMQVVLRPTGSSATNANLALLVYPPGRPLDGEPVERIDATGPGDDATYAADRATFNLRGYGDWTFVAAMTFVSTDGAIALPSTSGAAPFEVEVHAQPGATDERVVRVVGTQPVLTGTATSLAIRLVATAEPGEGENITLSADAWAHYRHGSHAGGEDDDANVTKIHPVDVPFQLDAAGVPTLVAGETFVAGPGVVNGPSMATVSEAVGYATALLMTSSVTTGGMFGKASRRAMNGVFGAAKRRVAFHNFLSYGILLAGSAHMVLFFVEGAFHWTVGLLWGGLAILALLGLGFTGALQVPLIRRWGYGGWRWTHYGLAVAAILFTVTHGALDGVHFTEVPEALGWRDPLVPGPVT